jgi:hypothetical protein
MEYNPKNLVAVMVHICDTFQLAHPQMIALRQKVEQTYHSQPVTAIKSVVKRKRKNRYEPVHLEGIAIALGLCLGFGGGATAIDEVLKLDSATLLKIGREYDPYANSIR